MAPEMFRKGDLTPSVDIYALGITLYEMLTGRLPFDASTPLQYINAYSNDPVPEIHQLRPELPAEMQYVIDTVLAKSPIDRYPTASALAEDLALALQVVTQPPEPEPAPPIQAESIQPAAPTPIASPTPQGMTPPDAQTMDVPLLANPTFDVEAASVPSIAPTPTRRAINPLLLAGGGLLAIAAIVGLLALSGLFAGGDAPAAQDQEPLADQPVAETVAAETGQPAAEPSTGASDTAVPIGFPGNPVTANDDWTPLIEEFDGVQMALVPAGCFMMGSESGEDDELPVHQQCFEQPFWIDVTEVTNAQFGTEGRFSGNNRRVKVWAGSRR